LPKPQWDSALVGRRAVQPASEALSKVKTVGDLLGRGNEPFSPIGPSTVIQLKDGGAATVAPGVW
jgi:hypothetical protein